MTTEQAGSEPVRLVTRFATLDTASADELVSILQEPGLEVAREPGLQDYDVCRDHDDPTVVWVVERWASERDARGHEAAASGRGGLQRVQALLLGGEFATHYLPVVSTITPHPAVVDTTTTSL